MNFLFRNKDWAVVEKESGQLTVPSRFQDQDSRKVLGLLLQEQIGHQIFPVHRLDFEVSGIVLWALNPEAHRIGQSWFEHKKIIKKYRALSYAQNFQHWPTNIQRSEEPISSEDRKQHLWKCKISKGKKRSFESPHGLDSVTEAQILGFKDGQLEWDLSPVTGRSHQLRFEMSRHGFPILGDVLYGSSLKNKNGIALRAYELNLSGIPLNERKDLPEVLSVDVKIKDFE